MDMTGERRIPAPRERVWNALNDPEVLKNCIPGCETLEKLSDTEMKATAAVRIGPIAARFNGRVQLTDLDPPNAYTIAGEGQGGVAGFAKGSARVSLSPDELATLLRYDVQAQVGGKIAQLGARLVDATAKSMADQFFDRFTAQVTSDQVAPGEVTSPVAPFAAGERPVQPEHPPAAAQPAGGISPLSLIPREPLGLPIVAWVGLALFALILLLLFGPSL
ncbi:MAG: carbon monoxide dehydrogenase subunit G [Alphaproteobacteria bacterium]|nr:carbon monoxide dehydrogenase subunit G [Alphaproteobacteria bacterium]